MSGDAKNTALWSGADVFIAPEGTAGPEDLVTAWGAAWDVGGLLDGEEGFTETRDGDTSEHYAWGGVLFKRTSSKHKRTFKFVALEDNDVIFSLVNPGSTRTTDELTGVRKGAIKVPKGARFAVGFEVREDGKTKRRYALSAEVQEIGEIKESETEPTVYEITVVIFPEADGTLYHTVETDPAFA
jgi:hypothetical protein